MRRARQRGELPVYASMGPRSDNRGYERKKKRLQRPNSLQWVRGLITAVIVRPVHVLHVPGPASMGPRSDNRGYQRVQTTLATQTSTLQWVRGLITAVIRRRAAADRRGLEASMGPRSDNRGYDRHFRDRPGGRAASMGPRSDNRGYRCCSQRISPGKCSFNGSAV